MSADPFDRLPQALARMMGERGLTQVELARRSGIGQPAISTYLTAKRLPTLDSLGRLLAAMGATVTDLGLALGQEATGAPLVPDLVAVIARLERELQEAKGRGERERRVL